MSQFFGKFIEQFPLEHDSLELSITSSSKLAKQRWRNNRLSADFVADYFSNLLPINENNYQSQELIQEIKSTVSYIGNELLENAIKFNEETKHHKVQFGIYFLEDTKITAVIFTKNNISTQNIHKYQAFINTLLTADPNDLYIQQIEAAAADEHSEASGLGLLTLVNDYSAKLGWKFESNANHPFITVTTMAQVVV